MSEEAMALLDYHVATDKTANYTDMLGKTPVNCHLGDFPFSFHSDFCGSMLVDNFSWNVKDNNYRHYFENTYKKSANDG